MLLRVNAQSRSAHREMAIQLQAFGLDERALQGMLFEQLDRLLPDDELLLVTQSRRWREEPLMALDADGGLYLFEPKVWESQTDNIPQTLRYGQVFGSYGYSHLDRIFRQARQTGQSLQEAHNATFGDDLAEDKFNRRQIFVIMTNGLDVKTREAIRHWRRAGLDVRPWIYRAYAAGPTDFLLELVPFRVADNPYEDVAQGYYVLNTNYRNDPEDDKEMIRNHRAAAFFDPWKRKIERLGRGDVVFLYRSGHGIVAVGIASGVLQKRAYHDDPQHPGEDYSMELRNFLQVSPPVSAPEIRTVIERDLSFRGTMNGFDEEAGKRLHGYLQAKLGHAAGPS